MIPDHDTLLRMLKVAQHTAADSELDAARVFALGAVVGWSGPHVTELVGQLRDAGLVDVRPSGTVRLTEAGQGFSGSPARAPGGGRVFNRSFQRPATGGDFGDHAWQTFTTGSPPPSGLLATLMQARTYTVGLIVADLAVALANLQAAAPGAPPEARAVLDELDPAVRDVIAATHAATSAATADGVPRIAPTGDPTAPLSKLAQLRDAVGRVRELCDQLGGLGEPAAKLAPWVAPVAGAAGGILSVIPT